MFPVMEKVDTQVLILHLIQTRIPQVIAYDDSCIQVSLHLDRLLSLAFDDYQCTGSEQELLAFKDSGKINLCVNVVWCSLG